MTLAAGCLVLAATAPAGALAADDPRAERDAVRAQKAGVASQVDALRASDADVSTALAALDDNVRGQQAALADAERAADEAEREAEAARRAQADKQREIDSLREQIAAFAVEAYVDPPTGDFLTGLEADNATDAVRRRSYLDLKSGRDKDLLDQLRAAEEDLDQQRERAESASAEAAERRDEVEARLDELDEARAQQASFAADVQRRLDAKLGEAAALEATDAQLSQQISQQEAELAARLRRSAPSGGGSGGGSGGYSGPIAGPISLASVRGIVVASSIAGQLESMLAAAAADGIVLGGSGYRDPSAQIALRRQHCGTSDYAVYEMPAEQCSPPTARPGSSKHEQGLAIDFTENGSSLTRSSAGFQWLSANAGRFGFANLPSEPWHWSVDGT